MDEMGPGHADPRDCVEFSRGEFSHPGTPNSLAAIEESKRLNGNFFLEERVAQWICTRLGPANCGPKERAMRVLEEAVELAQAEGITHAQVIRQAAHVFARPAGEPAQEAAGVAVCLFGWCASRGHRLMDLATAEIERIEAKPLEQIRGSLARKSDADLVCLAEQQAPSFPICRICGSDWDLCPHTEGHPAAIEWPMIALLAAIVIAVMASIWFELVAP